MARLRADYVFGTTTAALGTTDTTLSGAALARLPVVAGSDTAAVTLQNPTTGGYEIVWVTAHASAATTATIVRGQEGSTAAAWASGTTWTHGPTAKDVTDPVRYAGAWATGTTYPQGSLVDRDGTMFLAKNTAATDPSQRVATTADLTAIQRSGAAQPWNAAGGYLSLSEGAFGPVGAVIHSQDTAWTSTASITTNALATGSADGLAFGWINSAAPLTTLGGSGNNYSLNGDSNHWGLYCVLAIGASRVLVRHISSTGAITDLASLSATSPVSPNYEAWSMAITGAGAITISKSGAPVGTTALSAAMPSSVHLYAGASYGGSTGTFRISSLSGTMTTLDAVNWRPVAAAV